MKAFLFLTISLVVASVNGSSHGGKKIWACNFEDVEGKTCHVIKKDDNGQSWNRKRYDNLNPAPKHVHHGHYCMQLTLNDDGKLPSKPIFYLPIKHKGHICVSFYYKIGIMANLHLITSFHHQVKSVWKKRGQIHRSWHHAKVSVKIRHQEHVGFQAALQRGYYTGVAVDVIHVHKGSCH